MEVGSSGEWRKKRMGGEGRVAPKHVARLSLATSGLLARVFQRGSSVAPKHVA